MLGMIEEPAVEMSSISERREARRRDQEAMSAASWPWIREDLSSAKRVGRGTASPPEREAKTEEMSPSFFGAYLLCVAVAVAVAKVRV